MHNPEVFLENETYKFLGEFEIQTDHLISARRPDLVVVNNKMRTHWIADFVVPANHGVKLKESEKRYM